MARKRDPNATHGEKVIRLFAKLLFSRRPHSLGDLAEFLECSKPTVTRIVQIIEDYCHGEIEREKRGKELLLRIKTDSLPRSAAYLSQKEINLLWMCGAFTSRLLGKDLFEEVKEALDRSQPLVKGDATAGPDYFGALTPGTIDYTKHGKTIAALIEAMNEKRVCKVTYKAPWSERAKTFHIKPLKIFSYRDALYLHALRSKDPWQKKWVEPDFDPVLAIHRFSAVEKVDRKIPFEVPKNYDFEKAFNRTFGVIKEKPFLVEAEFTDWAAVYIEERYWSQDQEITRDGDKVRIKFTASSQSEVIAWILSFGDAARLLSPDWLVKEVVDNLNRMRFAYESYGPKP